ncbi:hypothetical protein GW17_00056589 [Ensete ventricosum]|nr:hypothetical protein GW17_00056589 [Ensete ventricosum]
MRTTTTTAPPTHPPICSHEYSSPPPPSAMPSPPQNGGGDAHPPQRRRHLILLLRLVTFGFSLAAAISIATNSSPSWVRFQSFRFVFAANVIVAAYSLFEMCATVHEILKGTTLFPEPMQLCFDFTHDQACF